MPNRKRKEIIIEDRGQSLKFEIVEMPVTQLEDWIIQVLIICMGLGAKVNLNGGTAEAARAMQEIGFDGLLRLDYKGKLKPLLDEMLGCCYRVIDKAKEKVTPESANGYIQDVKTLFQLRAEAFKVNINFSEGGGLSSFLETLNTNEQAAN